MKKYLPIIVFALNVFFLSTMFYNTISDVKPRTIIVIYGIILSFLFLFFWLYFPMTSKKKKSKK
jgi:amino acid permease